MISINDNFQGDEAPESEPAFQPGELVEHRKYGYRGVVVAADGHCTADPAWYMKNRTQPDRGQPWYHVLVHESNTVTYAAESSLRKDDGGQPVEHPLVSAFFDEFDAGGYVRNDTPWPG